jgi:hypothetical protein
MSANVLFTVDIIRELHETNVLLSYARRRSASSGARNWEKNPVSVGPPLFEFSRPQRHAATNHLFQETTR